MRLVGILIFLFSSTAAAEIRASFGLRLSRDEGSLQAGPALGLDVEKWSAELYAESDEEREHFHLELRYPISDRLELMGGTRMDRLDSLGYEGDALFAGARISANQWRAAPYISGRLFSGSPDASGFGAEAGALIALPKNLEILLSLEYDRLRAGSLSLDSTRAALRLRYTIAR